MCRCCQECLEDLYWTCIEEKFCYDETIAYYNPEEDEHYGKKSANGVTASAENNNSPIRVQPRLDRNVSSVGKIHEDDVCREIQTNVPILAPEILSVFANSHIFYDHQPKNTKPKSDTTPSVHRKPTKTNQDKLLERLEGNPSPATSTPDLSEFTPRTTISAIINTERPSSVTSSRQILSIKEEEEENESETDSVILRNPPDSEPPKAFLKPKSYFDFRPASENDIFTISKNYGSISMTPEIPSISYSNLPKNYLDTPKIEDYHRESVSLQSIQTANSARISEMEQMAMPRYFRKSDMIIQPARVHSAENLSVTPKRLEKSKRLISLRTELPPLTIGSTDIIKQDSIKRSNSTKK